MGDVLPPHITAAIVNEDNSAAAIVLVPVSLPEVGRGGGVDFTPSRPRRPAPFVSFRSSNKSAPPEAEKVDWTLSPHLLASRCHSSITRTNIHPETPQAIHPPPPLPPVTPIDEFHASRIRQQLSKQTAFDR